MAWIYRVMGPGEHVFGETTLVFDEESLAECDDEEIIKTARHFKTLFAVYAEHPEPPAEPVFEPEPEEPEEASEEDTAGDAPLSEPVSPTDTSARFNQGDLEALTVAELRELATAVNIQRGYSLNKTELITALLASQEDV